MQVSLRGEDFVKWGVLVSTVEVSSSCSLLPLEQKANRSVDIHSHPLPRHLGTINILLYSKLKLLLFPKAPTYLDRR